MEYVFIPLKDDLRIINDYQIKLIDLKDNELIQNYNHEAKIGIVGVRQQIRYLLAMRKEFLKRFGVSPVYVSEKYVVGLTGPIELVNNRIRIKY